MEPRIRSEVVFLFSESYFRYIDRRGCVAKYSKCDHPSSTRCLNRWRYRVKECSVEYLAKAKGRFNQCFICVVI